ncbi:MAG: thioredoxin [candidate division Zixibacteria bacterium]|nr:thioredoxin [candidate division Zixibacteria bacterium]
MANITEFTDSNWDDEVLKSDLPVVIDFWAEWCGPCRMVAPIVEELSDEYNGKVKFGKLDVDNNSGTAARYGIRSIPTLLIFKNGDEVGRLIGAKPKNQMVKELEPHIG